MYIYIYIYILRCPVSAHPLGVPNPELPATNNNWGWDRCGGLRVLTEFGSFLKSF